jgi:cytochrome c biogenesis protein CcmG/thiol:disulfide interchange protein DsbE
VPPESDDRSTTSRSGAPPRGRPSRRLVWIVAGLGGAVVVAAIVVFTASNPPDPPEAGTPASGEAPEFQLDDVRDPDGTVALADFRGRPLVVNFFAAWCVPCRREMPALESAYQQVKDDVGFVGIDTEDIRSDGLALLEETEVTYPAAFDPDGKVARDFGVIGMPTTVFVSPTGEKLEQVTGEITEERLLAAIERLFADERPSPRD